MEEKDLFNQVKEFQDKLDKTEFSQWQKEILFQEKVRSLFNIERISEVDGQDPKVAEVSDSFSSLVNRAGINQHMDFVLFAVYYDIVVLKKETVNTKDINGEYQLARIKSSNTSVFVNNLIKKGMLMLSGKKEGFVAYVITRDGVKYVEEKLKNGEV